MSGAERLTRWLAEIRASGAASLIARAVIALAGTVALLVPAMQSWDEMDAVPVVGVPLLLVCIVLPDSAAALVFIVLVVLGWIMRAPGEVSVSVAITGIALVMVHLASAFAGQIPSYGQVSRRAIRRWLLPATVGLLLGPVVAIAAALVRGAAIPGSLLVTVGALAAATAAIWFASGQSIGSD